MRKYHFYLFVTLIIFASCGNKSKFDDELKVAYKEMTKSFSRSDYVCASLIEAWRIAVYDNKTPSGENCSDFHVALNEKYEELDKSGDIDTLSIFKESMQVATSKLNNPPFGRRDCYDDFVDIVSEVCSLERMATNPSGDILSYNSRYQRTHESIEKKIDQFKIRYAEILINEDEKINE